MNSCTLADETRWFSLNNLPPLILDHRDMILKAHARLREKVVTMRLDSNYFQKNLQFHS